MKKLTLLLALALVFLLLFPTLLESHTPYRPRVVFDLGYPDRPISGFAAGRTEVIDKGWGGSYLLVAYRYLLNRPLSAEEQRSFLNHPELHADFAFHPLTPQWWKEQNEGNHPPQQWLRARSAFRTDPPPSNSSPEWWKDTLGDDCLADSFRTAIRTLHDRARRYGKNNPLLQDWISAQDQVYENCPASEGGHLKKVIPPELSASAPELARADRVYQIAAAHFYAGDHDEAIQEFEAIARDQRSPWHDWGIYLAARMLLRKASANPYSSLELDAESHYDTQGLIAADAKLELAEQETRILRLKRDIAGLREFTALRLHPEQQFSILSRRLALGDSDGNFGQDIIDFDFLLYRKIGNHPDFPHVDEWSKEYGQKVQAWYSRRHAEVRSEQNCPDLCDWLLSLQPNDPAGAQHALQRWKQKRSLPWLVAALANANADKTVDAELLHAAAEVPVDSYAYATVRYHLARLLRESGNYDESRRIAADVLAHEKNWPISSVNLFRREQFLAAASLQEFIEFLPRQPVGFSDGSVTRAESDYCDPEGWDVKCEAKFEAGTPKHLLPQFDLESAVALNQNAPLHMLIDIANSGALPENLTKELAPAVWTRAVVLDRPADAASVADVTMKERPELTPFIRQYESTKTEPERKFLAAYAIAHFPGMRPTVNGPENRVTRFDYADNYRDNWWCANGLPQEFESGSSDYWRDWADYDDRVQQVGKIALFSQKEWERGAHEFEQIAQGGDPGNWLPNVLIDWAKSHPSDERSPEALHYAWRVMKYSCDGKVDRMREVVVLLHRRYPNSVWTKKTKWWF